MPVRDDPEETSCRGGDVPSGVARMRHGNEITRPQGIRSAQVDDLKGTKRPI